jgi:hypothetical protein
MLRVALVTDVIVTGDASVAVGANRRPAKIATVVRRLEVGQSFSTATGVDVGRICTVCTESNTAGVAFVFVMSVTIVRRWASAVVRMSTPFENFATGFARVRKRFSCGTFLRF